LEQVQHDLDALLKKKSDLEASQARRQEQLEALNGQIAALEAQHPVASASALPASFSSGGGGSGTATPSGAGTATPPARLSGVRKAFEDVAGSELDPAEASRLARTMSRPKGPAAVVPQRSQGEVEAEREAAEAEVRRKREEQERRKRDEEAARQKLADDQHEQKQQQWDALQQRSGTPTLFEFKDCYDYDSDVQLVADFTEWKGVPMARAGESLDFSVSVPLDAGVPHLYYFLVNGKREIDKLKPTGFGNGVLCNRIQV